MLFPWYSDVIKAPLQYLSILGSVYPAHLSFSKTVSPKDKPQSCSPPWVGSHAANTSCLRWWGLSPSHLNLAALTWNGLTVGPPPALGPSRGCEEASPAAIAADVTSWEAAATIQGGRKWCIVKWPLFVFGLVNGFQPFLINSDIDVRSVYGGKTCLLRFGRKVKSCFPNKDGIVRERWLFFRNQSRENHADRMTPYGILFTHNVFPLQGLWKARPTGSPL